MSAGGPRAANGDSFPRQSARTRRFTLGAPRSFTAAGDGSRVVFLRSPDGEDPNTELWAFDVAVEAERRIVGPADLIALAGAGEVVRSAEEQARRERVRETAGGIVTYAIDRDAGIAAIAFGGELFTVDLGSGQVRRLDVPVPVFDPRPDPTGRRIAFVCERVLHVVELASGGVSRLAGEPEPAVSWGTAEFVAAEEMGRQRGYWWAPDGEALLVTRVDETPVTEWWIGDPAHPQRSPRAVRYPAAGTPNAAVSAFIVALTGGPPTPVAWDTQRFPYLASATWDPHGPLIAVQSRDQRRLAVVCVDTDTGQTTLLDEQRDPVWVDLVDGVPARLGDRRLVTVGSHAGGDMPALMIDGTPVTPVQLEVSAVCGVAEDAVLFTAAVESTERALWRWCDSDGLRRLTDGPGVHTGVWCGDEVVIGSAAMDHDGVRWSLRAHRFASHAAHPVLTPTVEFLTVGPRELRVGLVLPADHDGGPLPVLMDPYGGPHHQEVMRVRAPWRESQWLADQGFAVIVADGRGTPGRGRAWARAVHGDLAMPVLQDQIDALHGVVAARADLDLDLTRVAIRGWSFGGFLAALAVIRRPDAFHAAVAGAPVTDWRLYDTHYTERYLGTDPDGDDRPAYERSSLLAEASSLSRPLLLIHGLADDNVVVAHTLTLSQRLSECGIPHGVLPLSGITHMANDEAVAENLLRLQVRFLHDALGKP